MKSIPPAASQPLEYLSSLQQQRGNICVSVIIPTHRILPDWRTDQLRLETTIQRAKENLRFAYRDCNIQPLLQSIDALCSQVDFTQNQEGLGLFVSPDIQLLVQFPFPVWETVTVADHFELRDLYWKASYSLPYFVLYVQQDKVRLFYGVLQSLNEVKDGNFPVKCTEDPGEGNPIACSNFANGPFSPFGRPAACPEDRTCPSFVQKADELLDGYLTGQAPLIVLGDKHILGSFMNITVHTGNIAGIIPGNYNFLNDDELAGKAWLAFLSCMEEKKRKKCGSMSK